MAPVMFPLGMLVMLGILVVISTIEQALPSVPVSQQVVPFATNLINQLPSIIGALAGMMGVAFAGYVSVRNLGKRQELVLNSQDIKLENIQHTATDTHTLVNNNMAIVLRKLAVKARRAASLSGSPEDISDAEGAELDLAEHLAKQNLLDVSIKDRVINSAGTTMDKEKAAEVDLKREQESAVESKVKPTDAG